ncbi:MAG: hypothetical protein J5685_13100 [Clostridiales bacterium]|nr:hypothetical protein [Clostridiales bacterium]
MQKFYKFICGLLAVLTAFGYFSQDLSKTVNAASSDVFTYHLPYYHPSGEYPGGWVRHEGDAIYFFEISEMPGKIAYCMEPGRSRSNGTVANSQTPEQAFAAGNNVLTGEQIKNFTEIILSLGYKGSPASLTVNNGVSDPNDNLYYAVATQILLWEVIIGERDASFNYRNTGTRNLADLILGPVDDTVSSDVRAFHEGEDYWYRRIEEGVRNYLFNRTIPSFAYETPEQAAAAVSDSRYLVDPGTRTIVLTDTNGVLSLYPHLSFSVNGQAVDVDYALDTAGNRVTIAFNDRSLEIDDVLLTIRSDVSSRRFALVYGDGRWGPDWAETDNWQEITTWGEEEYDYVYVRFTDDIGFSVTKVADSSGDIVNNIAFNLWRYGEGRSSGFYNAGAGDTLVAAGFTDSRGRLVWESVGDTSLDLPAGNYGINEIYVPTYFDAMDGNRIQYPYDIPTDGSRTWLARGNTMENHMFYTSFVLNGRSDVNFVLHNHRSQGGFSLNKSINPIVDGFSFDDLSFTLYYDTDNSSSVTSGDYRVAEGNCDSSGKVWWNGSGFSSVYNFTTLPSGNYVIRESWTQGAYTVINDTPGWNRIDDTTYDMPINIPSGGNRTYTVVNRPQTGSVSAIKRIEGGGELFDLSAVTFALYNDLNGNGIPDTGENIATGVPRSSDGRVIWNGGYNGRTISEAETVDRLPYGQYIIEESWPSNEFEVENISSGWVRVADGRYRRAFEIGSASRDMIFTVDNVAHYAGIDVFKRIPAGDTFDIGTVSFILRNNDTGRTVAYGVPGSDGHVIWDRDVSSGLAYGSYTLTEIWPSQTATCEDGTILDIGTVNNTEGWVRNAGENGDVSYSITFTLDTNRVYTFEVENEELTNSLRIYKVPLTEGDESDVRFELLTSEGDLYATAVAHTTGIAGEEDIALWQLPLGESEMLTRIPEGTYTLREYIPMTFYTDPSDGNIITAPYTYDVPEGFTLSPDGTYFYRSIEITDGENGPVSVRAENRRLEASLLIRKVSEDGQVGGLTFRLVYRGDSETFDNTMPSVTIGTFVTGDDGSVSIGKLPSGWYEITEVTPDLMVCRWADGSNGNVKRIYIDPSSEASYEVTAINTISAILRVRKVDEWTGEAVGGASFNLYRDWNSNGIIDPGEEDSFVCCNDVDGDGMIYFPGLSGGDYILREAVTVEGYCLNEREFPVSVTEPDIYDITVEETPVTLNICLYKVDENDAGHFLSGAQFSLYHDDNGNGELDDGDGIATSFYDGSFVSVNVILTEDNYHTPVYMLDRPVRPGTYFLVETVPPEGFVLNENNCVKIELASDAVTSDHETGYYLTNGLHGGIRIRKIDEDYPDRMLTGALFTVYSDTNGDGIYTEGIDLSAGTMEEVSEGEYLITGLPYGLYFIRETESPDGYIRRDDVWSVNVTSDSVIYEIRDTDFPGICNSPEGIVTVYKHDEDYPDEILSGAEFTVYSGDDGSVVGILSEENGIYTLGGLASGSYNLVETRAPEGFVRDTDSYPFTVSRGNRSIVIDNTENVSRPQEGCFVNSPVRATIRIQKIVPSGYSLSGFTFEVSRDGEVIATVTTDSTGCAYVEGLRFGTYVITELASDATNGTFHIASPQTVVIRGDAKINGTVIEVDIENRPVDTPKASPTPQAPNVPSTGESLIGIARICGILSVAVGAVLLIYIRRKGERDA